MESKKNLSYLFLNYEKKDPALIISESTIKLIPFYWNYSFLSCFFPLVGSAYAITQVEKSFTVFLFILLLLFSIYIVVRQLLFYNNVVLDLKKECLVLRPNLWIKSIIKTKVILFKNIKKVDYIVDGFWSTDKRYILRIKVGDEESLRLISTNESSTASWLVSALTKLFQHFK